MNKNLTPIISRILQHIVGLPSIEKAEVTILKDQFALELQFSISKKVRQAIKDQHDLVNPFLVTLRIEVIDFPHQIQVTGSISISHFINSHLSKRLLPWYRVNLENLEAELDILIARVMNVSN